jgi:hypothetical protein
MLEKIYQVVRVSCAQCLSKTLPFEQHKRVFIGLAVFPPHHNVVE